MARILLVEDEKMLARYVELELTHEGYEVDVANDGREGLDKALEDKHDLMLLDLMLPRLSGIEICRRVRQHSTKPIIMLTAKDDVSDKVMGLDMGADDYVTKPFAIEELLARIRVALKHGERARTGADSDGRLSAGPLVVNPRNRQVSFGGEEVALTKTEFDMLAYMVAPPGQGAQPGRVAQRGVGLFIRGRHQHSGRVRALSEAEAGREVRRKAAAHGARSGVSV